MDKELAAERRLAFGEELKKTREARGLSLESLAHETRIRLDFIQSLEEGAFEKLPGEVFGRGFVRSISRTLGVEANELISLFDAAWGPSATPQSVLKVEIKNKPSRDSGEQFKIKWANLVSIVKRGLGLHSMGLFLAILLVLGSAGVGLWKGSTQLYGFLKGVTSGERQSSAGHSAGGERKIASSKASIDEQSPPRSSDSLESNESESKGLPPRSSDAPASSISHASLGNREQSVETPVTASHNGSSSLASPSALDESSVAAKNPFEMLRAEGRGTSKAEALGQQVLELVVTEPVRIKLETDQQPPVSKELSPDTYRFTFDSKAELMVYDAAALKVLFNGKPLGSLGNKGRVRRLSFQSDPFKMEKKL